MSIRVENVKKKILFSDAIVMVKEDLEGCEPLYNLLCDGKGILLPLLMKYTYYEENEGIVSIMFLDRTVTLPVSVANVFWYCTTLPVTAKLPLHMPFCNVGDYHYSNQFYDTVEVPKVGQSKLCIGTLEVLVDMGPELHMLVIGSGGDPGSGQTYEMLLDYLGKLGYYGSMLFLDPCETPRIIKTDSFMVEFSSDLFDYSKPYHLLSPAMQSFNVVLDDAWMPTWTKELHSPVTYDSVELILENGTSKFAYSCDNGRLVLRNGLLNHADLPGAIGGGYMICRKPLISIYGTSSSRGPYDKDLVYRLLSRKGYSVQFTDKIDSYGRYTWDPGLVLRNVYPKARISMKCFSEDIPGPGRFASQIWYEGYERRFFYNVPELPNVVGGCGCYRCLKYSYIRTYFNIHNNASANIVDYMLSRVIRDKCLKHEGSKFNGALGAIVAFSKGAKDYESVVSLVSKNRCVSEEVVDRAAHYLYMKGVIMLTKGKFYPLRDFTIRKEDCGVQRFYNSDMTHYVERRSKKLRVFDLNGRDVTKVYRSGILSYVRGEIEGKRKFIDEVFAKYSDIISIIDGYDFVGTGTLVCGFTDDYPLYISSDKRASPIFSKGGWYLYNSSLGNEEDW